MPHPADFRNRKQLAARGKFKVTFTIIFFSCDNMDTN